MSDAQNAKEKKKLRRKLAKQRAKAKVATEGFEMLKKQQNLTPKRENKVSKVLERRAKVTNDYLRAIIDPFVARGSKIPDYITYPSTTFFTRQRWEPQTDAGGEFAMLAYPWHNSHVLSKAVGFGGTGTNMYDWTGMTWTNAAKNTSIISTFSMVRPVAMGIRLSYVGKVLDSGGTIVAALYDPNTNLPSNYDAITTAPEYKEFSVTGDAASIEVIWKPLSYVNTNAYHAVGDFITPNFLAHAWFPTAGNLNTQVAVPAFWSRVTGGGVTLHIEQSGVPALILGCKGFPATASCVRVEIIAHYEATIQSQTLSIGQTPQHTPSPVDTEKYSQAHAVVANAPLAHAASEHSNFVQRVVGAAQSVGRVIDAGVHLVGKVAPLAAMMF